MKKKKDKTKKKDKAINIKMDIGLSNGKGDTNMVKILKNLKVGEETSYLLNCGTLRITLNKIDKARVNMRLEDRDAKFIFGRTIKDGNNKFIGISVKRVS